MSDTSITPKKSLPPISDLLYESFEIFKKTALSLFVFDLIAIVVYVIITVVLFFVLFLSGVGAVFTAQAQNYALTGGIVIAGVIGLILFLLFAMAFGVVAGAGNLLIVSGKGHMSMDETIKKSIALILPMIGLGFISFFLVLGGFFLFIIPALIFGVFFTFSTYELVFENKRGLDALRSSMFIVSQNFWGIIGRFLLLSVFGFFIGVIVSLVFQLPLIVLDEKSVAFGIVSIISFIVQVIVNIVFSFFNVAYGYTLYQHAKSAAASSRESSLLWVFIVSIIGWIISILLLSTIGLVGYQMIKSGAAKGLLEKAKEVDKKQQNYQDQKEKMSPATELIKSGQLKLETANQLAGKTSLTEDDKAQIRGLINGALDDFNSATEKDPTNYQAWYYRGEAYRNLIGLAKNADTFAIASYKKALEFRPYDYSIYLALGGVYF